MALTACVALGIVEDSVAMDAGFRVDGTLNGTPVRVDRGRDAAPEVAALAGRRSGP